MTPKKFRGKRKDNGEWVEGYYVYTHDGDLDDVHRHLIYRYDNADFINNFHEVIPETVGQYTGLHWQDDVLESKDGLRRYVVAYNEVQCKWYLKGINKAWNVNDVVWSKYKHIGDIHSNPKLLEQK